MNLLLCVKVLTDRMRGAAGIKLQTAHAALRFTQPGQRAIREDARASP
ncbi:MAG TPA: hypothetical protein VHN17_16265 [Steroidobacteraceae bacterium]|nr:hypothetical protein [Steroidobacteraceae bacterium]